MGKSPSLSLEKVDFIEGRVRHAESRPIWTGEEQESVGSGSVLLGRVAAGAKRL